MTAGAASTPRIVFVIEGGRSRHDLLALDAVATAAERAGATVTVLRHGLGRLSTRAVQRAIRERAPEVIITTGATSTRDTEKAAKAARCPLICYYWPAGAVEDIHRKSRPGHRPRRPAKAVAPTLAVVGSPLHRDALLHYLTGAHGQPLLHAEQVAIVPPWVEVAVRKAEPVSSHGPESEPLELGVYGGHGAKLPKVKGCRYVELDAPLAAMPARAAAAHDSPELSRLRSCAAVLMLGGDTTDEREAPRRCATALLLGKPVLASGFGASGREPPLVLPEPEGGPGLAASGALQTAAPEELEAALGRWLDEHQQQLLRDEHYSLGIDLHPELSAEAILKQHLALIWKAAGEGVAHQRKHRSASTEPKRGPAATAKRLLTRLRSLLRPRSRA